jgi:hypothetical protein
MQVKYIILWIFVLSIVYFLVRLVVERRKRNKMIRFLIEKGKSSLVSPPIPKAMPKIIYRLVIDDHGVISEYYDGDIKLIVDLLGFNIRTNKKFRDMIKSAFRKSGKALG